jgi:hypothetical protein
VAEVQQQFAAHRAAIKASPKPGGVLAELRRLAVQPLAHSRRLAQQQGGDADAAAPGAAEQLLLYRRARGFAWKSKKQLQDDVVLLQGV